MLGLRNIKGTPFVNVDCCDGVDSELRDPGGSLPFWPFLHTNSLNHSLNLNDP